MSLTPELIQTVKSTIPAVAEAGPELAKHFYKKMLGAHPELKNVFNMANQRGGTQPEALFNFVCAVAANLDNLEPVMGDLERIAQKHVSLNILPEQYPIVGENLLASIKDLLNPGDEILAAWGVAYGVLANAFINREEEIYQEHEHSQGGWRGMRKFKIVAKNDESSVIKSFEFAPVDGKEVCGYKPGQYLAISLTPEGTEYVQHRQYSLTKLPDGKSYHIAVKREDQGAISRWLHDQATVGTEVDVVAPSGDFFIEIDEKSPVTLISGGVGQTPLLSMLGHLAATGHKECVGWYHSAQSGAQHAMADRVEALGKKLPKFHQKVWYNTPSKDDKGKYDFEGYMDLKKLDKELFGADREFYLCGPTPFMSHVENQLIDLGVSPSKIHYETFGPRRVL